tara:strand:- start:24 stop:911 length:888 start_codon:yes stop_codon:yes gene_type:complete
MSNELIPVSFHGDDLALIDHDGEPFVAMKPVVEGMGLDWKAQHRRLTGERFGATMVIMTIVAQDGKSREMACLPLRKLTGWMVTVNANKVKPELKEKIIAYQNECDDALWEYWSQGFAVNRRAANGEFTQGAIREFQVTRLELVQNVTSMTESSLRLAGLLGFEGNQGRLYADKLVKRQLGIGPMELLGVTGLVNQEQELHYTATELGKKHSMSANSMNKLLAQVGLQRRFEYAQGKHRWELTPEGRKHGVILDTAKRHSDGTPVQQIRWRESVLQVLQGLARQLQATLPAVARG